MGVGVGVATGAGALDGAAAEEDVDFESVLDDVLLILVVAGVFLTAFLLFGSSRGANGSFAGPSTRRRSVTAVSSDAPSASLT